MKKFSVVLFFLLVFISGCCHKNCVQKEPEPFDYSGFCALDLKRNGDLENSSVLDVAIKEKRSKSIYYSVLSHMGSNRKKRYNSVSSDIRLVLLDRAVCFMTAELFPQYVPEFSMSRRRSNCLKLLANIREYRTLDKADLLTVSEKETFDLLMLEASTAMDIELRRIAESFDYSTLPQYSKFEKTEDIPNWMEWNNETLLLWTKLLMQLPQEIMRSPGIDRAKVALCAMKISRAVAERAVKEHMQELQLKVFDSTDLRRRCRMEYEMSLAYAWQKRFPSPELEGDFQKEEQFLSDLLQLVQ